MTYKNVLYVLTSADINSSVTDKVSSQILALRKCGVNAQGVYFSSEPEPKDLESFIIWIDVGRLASNFFVQLKYRILMNSRVNNFLKSEMHNYDYVYLRYYGSFFGLGQIVRKQKNFVIEVQSDGFEELKAGWRAIKYNSFVSYVFSYVQYFFIPYTMEFLFRKWTLKNAFALVSPTKELQEKNSKYNKKSLLLSNGINVANYIEREISEKVENRWRLLFLKGSVTEIEYDGIERIIESIAKSNIKDSLELVICGRVTEAQLELIAKHKFVKFMGYVKGKEMEDLIQSSHLGVCTMALYKKGLNELSALKTRQYALQGLPFIYSGFDTDISQIPEFEKYSLRFPNDDSLIDMEVVTEFLERVYKIPNDMVDISNLAIKYLSWDVKMDKLFKEIIGIQPK